MTNLMCRERLRFRIRLGERRRYVQLHDLLLCCTQRGWGLPHRAGLIVYSGDVLYGYCGGAFGRDSYGDKIVVAMGRDWIVCREKGSMVVGPITSSIPFHGYIDESDEQGLLTHEHLAMKR